MGEGETSRDRLKVGETGTIQINTAQDAIDFATWCFESGYLPRHIENPKQAFTIMQRGAEMGLPPFAAWRFIYQTKGGKLALESKGALAVCQSKASFGGYKERIEGEGDGMRGVGIAWRKGDDDPTIKEFTMEDAKRAGLLKRPTNRRGEAYDGPWQLYLKDMLLSKARERALSIAFGAELGGIPIEGLAEEIEARESQKATAAQGLRARMHAVEGSQPKALPEGSSSTMTDLIRGKDFVAQPGQKDVEMGEPPEPMAQVISDQVDAMFKAEVVADMEAAKPVLEYLKKGKKEAPEPLPPSADDKGGALAPKPGPPEPQPITTCQFKVGPSALCSGKVVDGTTLCSAHHFEEEKAKAGSPFAAALRGRAKDKLEAGDEKPTGQEEMFGPPEEE